MYLLSHDYFLSHEIYLYFDDSKTTTYKGLIKYIDKRFSTIKTTCFQPKINNELIIKNKINFTPENQCYDLFLSDFEDIRFKYNLFINHTLFKSNFFILFKFSRENSCKSFLEYNLPNNIKEFKVKLPVVRGIQNSYVIANYYLMIYILRLLNSL